MILINRLDQELSIKESKVHLKLMEIQKEYKLSDCEMIEVLHNFTARYISHFIKHEHANDEVE
jgi:hypothetical protein